ncbi:hypothetical protein OROHE_012783 [Orobanche hederae]
MPLSCFFTLSFIFLFIHALPFIAQGVVPPSQSFNYVNEGEFGDYVVEYNANYRVLRVSNSPFQLCFYNTTPGAYTLALRMGTVRSESRMRWVWEANRGNPVGESATFSLGTNGNLVLADADGRVVWQSNTVDKGVVGFKLLPNGNMVLYDSKGNFVWQSFDFPTDTVLVGQSLRLKGPNKLVSRLSQMENKNGRPETDGAFAYELMLENPDRGNRILPRPKYNSTLTYLRLGIDGGLRAYTFYDKVDYGAWEETFTLFPRDSGEECGLPGRCGEFGLCEDSQCVACPSPNGLLGWSKRCSPPKMKYMECKLEVIEDWQWVPIEKMIQI